MLVLPRPVTSNTSPIPAAAASSTMYCRTGRSTTGSSSFGTALVAGRKRVASPAAGMTALTARVRAAGSGVAMSGMRRDYLSGADRVEVARTDAPLGDHGAMTVLPAGRRGAGTPPSANTNVSRPAALAAYRAVSAASTASAAVAPWHGKTATPIDTVTRMFTVLSPAGPR